MSDMLDPGTEKYFNEKFKNLHGKLDSVLQSQIKSDDKIDLVEKDVTVLMTYKESHEKHHESKEKNMKFNLEMWVIVGIFALDKIYQYIERFFP